MPVYETAKQEGPKTAATQDRACGSGLPMVAWPGRPATHVVDVE